LRPRGILEGCGTGFDEVFWTISIVTGTSKKRGLPVWSIARNAIAKKLGCLARGHWLFDLLVVVEQKSNIR
jgi:hypothetical protein